MKRILIARGAGDPEQLRTQGLPRFDALGALGEEADEAAEETAARPQAARAPARTRSTRSKGGMLSKLVFLLIVTTLGVGGYWLWMNPEVVGLEDWSSVQAAFTGDEESTEAASPEAPAEAGSPEAPAEEAPTEPQEAAE